MISRGRALSAATRAIITREMAVFLRTSQLYQARTDDRDTVWSIRAPLPQCSSEEADEPVDWLDLVPVQWPLAPLKE
jgi:hypothetical protein